jgi:hypothetical protein
MDTIFIGAKQAAAATTARRRRRRRRLRKAKNRGKEEGSLITSEGKGKPAMVTAVVLQPPPLCNWALLRAKGEREGLLKEESVAPKLFLLACSPIHMLSMFSIVIMNSFNNLPFSWQSDTCCS